MSNPRFWMQTYSGKSFHFDRAFDLDLRVNDIAKPLSRLPRFLGHTTRPLYVAEHSVAVAYVVGRWGGSKLVCLHALMHDAHEAFTGDMPAPFKRFLRETYLLDIDAIQAEFQFNILASLGIPALARQEDVELIHKADLLCCKIERDTLMKSQLEWDIDDIKVPREFINLYSDRPLSPADAYKEFKTMYKEFRE